LSEGNSLGQSGGFRIVAESVRTIFVVFQIKEGGEDIVPSTWSLSD